MRVTHKQTSDMVNTHLMKRTEAIQTLQKQIYTGKQINKVSDDPIKTGNILDYRETMSSIDQYMRNINQGANWLRTTDATLGEIDDLMVRCKELAVYQSTETATSTTRAITAEEVSHIYDQIIQLANTKIENRYIFSGHQTADEPFSRDGSYTATYAGDTGEIRIIIGESVDMLLNLDGEQVFNSDEDLFDVVRDIKDAMEADDSEAIALQIDRLNTVTTQLSNARAKAGARLNRLETAEQHWSSFRLSTQEMLSETEDADLVQVFAELQTQEAAYEASLATTASLIQPNLLQFLR